MQKGNNSSKKGANLAQAQIAQQYKSELSKAASINKGNDKFSVQNIKEFKYEIDHEIAKCLDTLDRQGLKFLKETLRASKIFGLNTQELGYTQPIEEQLQFSPEPLEVKDKSSPKKSNPNKNVVVKKVTKPQQPKKPATSQKHSRNQTKNDLGEKIHKKLESMNIKTGKKQEIKGVEQAKKQESVKIKKIQPKSANQIVQQIEVEETNEQNAAKNVSVKIEQSINLQELSHSFKKLEPKNQQADLKGIKENQKNKAFEEKSVSTPTKPFCKKQFKKMHNYEHNKQVNQNYGIQISKEEEIREITKDEPDKVKIPSTQLQKQEHLSLSQKAQPVSEKASQQQLTTNQQVRNAQVKTSKQQVELQPQMANLIAKINKLSPAKRGKLQRILQKLQQSPLIETSMLSLGSNSSKGQISYKNPYIAQKNSFLKQSNTKQKSKSRSKFQKIQKASSIKSSLMNKRSQQEIYSAELAQKKQSQSRIELSCEQQSNFKEIPNHSGQAKVKKLQIEAKNVQNSHWNLRSNEESSKKLKEADKDATKLVDLKQKQELVSPTLIESGQRLIKIGKKKSQPTNVTIKILSNNGHPTLVSLSNITFFSQSGEVIQIDQANLKQPNPKTLKLFNVSSEVWTTQISNATVIVQNITQPLGGIRIVNFNKSQLENNKQADLAELFIQEQLYWRGQLKGGSFKQGQNYVTDIKISSKDFLFPNTMSNSITKSKLFEEKAVRQSLVELKDKKMKKEVDWLEKQSVYQKIRQIEEEQKNQSATKKIQNIRNTLISIPESKKPSQNVISIQPPVQQKAEFVIAKNVSRLKASEEKKYNLQSLNSPKEANVKSIKENQDILGQLSKSIATKIKQNQKEEVVIPKKKKQEQMLITDKEKEKKQDDQFEQILKNFQKNDRQLQRNNQNTQKEAKLPPQPAFKESSAVQLKAKGAVQKSLEQFMKDSLFDDIPKHQKFQALANKQKNQPKPKNKIEALEPKASIKKGNNTDLDDLIDELNDVVGTQCAEESGQQFTIPELPKGKELMLIVLSNWGNQQFTGLNGIQVFDTSGDIVRPSSITSSSVTSQQLLEKLCKIQLLTSDQQMQLKFPKSKKSVLAFNFAYKIEIAAIRIWNYNGHRVHSNIGVKKCHLKLDSAYIFSGEVQQSNGSSEDAYKYCQYLLFTENNNILKRLSDKDWLNKTKNNNENERMLFKSTLQNFHRPVTRNDEQNLKKEVPVVQVKKELIKLPKRLCFQYDPPQLPEGFVLKLVIHSSWGDHFFVGLNGIEVFNQKGEDITVKNLSQIRADPSSISRLQGYERDKRVVNNLINKKNNTTSDSDIWLAPLLSDVQKIQRGRANFILIEYSKCNKIAGLNFYNYTKTPERGVREIEVYLDQCLLYRGYLRRYNPQEGIIHTTINFTKQQMLLQAMNYVGYNEDHLEQEVGLINEGKIVKLGNQINSNQPSLARPMTGKLLI